MVSGGGGKKLENGAYSFGGKRVNSAQCTVTLKGRGRIYAYIPYVFIFEVPKKVLHGMESMRSYFFNGAELSSKKSVWVKWKHALASKDKGGLGVSSLFALNKALMFKWVWHFITQGSSLWARVIKALHSYDGLDVSFRRPPSGGVEIQQFEHMKEKVEGC
nr:RNA-directed DNA polymerase, eukaryota [Tanacetum cinerariifolium]